MLFFVRANPQLGFVAFSAAEFPVKDLLPSGRTERATFLQHTGSRGCTGIEKRKPENFEPARLPQNIDGGKSLDRVLNAVPKFVRSMRIPEKRNDRIR